MVVEISLVGVVLGLFVSTWSIKCFDRERAVCTSVGCCVPTIADALILRGDEHVELQIVDTLLLTSQLYYATVLLWQMCVWCVAIF